MRIPKKSLIVGIPVLWVAHFVIGRTQELLDEIEDILHRERSAAARSSPIGS